MSGSSDVISSRNSEQPTKRLASNETSLESSDHTKSASSSSLSLSSSSCSSSSLSLSLDRHHQHNHHIKKSKENEVLSCCCCNGGKCDGTGSQRRLVDEKDLREILMQMQNQNFRSKQRNQSTNVNNVYQEQKNVANQHLLEEWDQFYSFPRLLLANNANENELDPFVLQPSLFHKNHVPPTIYFTTKISEDSRPPIGLPNCLQHFFKWKISSITPNSIRNCITYTKFDTIRPSNAADENYLGSWCKHMLTTDFAHLEEWRKVNHYPGSFHLGRKDKLWFRLKLARQKFDQTQLDNFHPTTFVMPRDYLELKEYWEKSPSKLFIIKPPASARGNGIQVINDISQIPATAVDTLTYQIPVRKSTMIVQQYISNPCLLENGQKFDLRVYVLLTSIDPLRIYVYDQGLVRFASTKYTSQEDGIINQYMHLTNYFINKHNQEYQINNDCDSLHGCKWTLKRFWRYLAEYYTHIDAQQLWDNIIDIIIKTIICCEGPMARLSNQHCKNDYTSYELFGFDILLDENFKPWILEVNITPSLKSESDLDTSVKYGVIKDMFNLVGYNLPPLNCSHYFALSSLLTEYRLFFDNRLYSENLTKRDKLKQLKFVKLFKTYLTKNYTNTSSKHASCGQQLECYKVLSQQDSVEPVNCVNNQVPNIEELEINGYGVAEERSIKLHYSSNQKNVEATSDDDESGLLSCKQTSDSILDDLTQNDIRVLMLSEDELSRCGQFKRVFPSATSSKYFKYFDRPRYYNLLLDAWEQEYKDKRLEGINRLSNLAEFLDSSPQKPNYRVV